MGNFPLAPGSGRRRSFYRTRYANQMCPKRSSWGPQRGPGVDGFDRRVDEIDRRGTNTGSAPSIDTSTSRLYD